MFYFIFLFFWRFGISGNWLAENRTKMIEMCVIRYLALACVYRDLSQWGYSKGTCRWSNNQIKMMEEGIRLRILFIDWMIHCWSIVGVGYSSTSKTTLLRLDDQNGVNAHHWIYKGPPLPQILHYEYLFSILQLLTFHISQHQSYNHFKETSQFTQLSSPASSAHQPQRTASRCPPCIA